MISIELAVILGFAILACLSLVISIHAIIEIKAMQRSTHKIQFVNQQQLLDPQAQFETLTEETKEELRKQADPFRDNI